MKIKNMYRVEQESNVWLIEFNSIAGVSFVDHCFKGSFEALEDSSFGCSSLEYLPFSYIGSWGF